MANEDPDMLPEYELEHLARGRHFAAFAEGTNLVLIDPDIARALPSAELVNAALREYLVERDRP